MEIQVKICGLVNKEDVEAVNAAGADYAGFVFFPKSKRNLSIHQAKMLLDFVKPSIRKVAVTVAPDDDLIDLLNEMNFDLIQMHGNVTEHMIERSRHSVWQAVNITHLEETANRLLSLEKVKGYVLDAASYGSGKTFVWDMEKAQKLRALMQGRQMVLAGGLHPGNVQEGIRIFSPDVVDVSSGVELADDLGKDRKKVFDFIQKAKASPYPQRMSLRHESGELASLG